MIYKAFLFFKNWRKKPFFDLSGQNYIVKSLQPVLQKKRRKTTGTCANMFNDQFFTPMLFR